MKGGKILGLDKNVFFLGLVSFFNDFSAEMVIAVLPAFISGVLGAPPIFLGLMEGVADALASFWKIVSGWFSDKIHRRKIIAVSGYSLSVGVRFFLTLAGNIWQVFAIRLIDRIGKGSREAPRDALLAESVEYSDTGRSFGYQRAMDTLGGVFGAYAAIKVFGTAQNYKLLFLISFLIGTLAVLSFFFVREIRKPVNKSAEVIVPRLSFSVKKFPNYFKVFILAIFVFGLGSMPLSLMLLKVKDISPDSIYIYVPIMYFVYNLSFALFAIPFGRFSDKIGKRKIISGGFLMAIIAYIVFANFSSVFSIYIGFILFGLYSAMTDGVERAKTSKLVNPRVLAEGEGFLGAAGGISSLLAGIIGGSIWTWVGQSAAFTYGAVMMTIGLILFVYWNGFSIRHIDIVQKEE